MLTKPENLELVDGFKETLPPEIYREFLRRKGTDHLLCFYIHWSRLGFAWGSVSKAYLRAEYAPKWWQSHGSHVKNHPAVKFLYASVGRDDLGHLVELSNLWVEKIKDRMNSESEDVCVKACALWQRWVEKNRDLIEQQLARAERVQQAITEYETKEISPDELVRYFRAAAAELRKQGHDPIAVLASSPVN